ncbi:MobV family relaxase [Vagococcus lutrae]|uniref:MobV family relaxase n=1 Tax=Vagococcus lutrae TaxID=81947 RepID=UPI00288DDBC3|nr:MobV family relaxase [Vagococcus lutrae]MDT2842592.1 MobV family relaxase [Vagococcus lutrae]
MELAWNTQKNQMSDVKGKEMEQERKGKISNEDIDLEKTKYNYDLVEDERPLYQRVKSRVEELKESGSRVQKNSVVMYSNILTVPEEQAKIWGEEKTDEYFKACYDFFSKEFGVENVVSAKIHKDETTPHMHLHFVPVNKENGRLQARVSMNKAKINYIHDELPIFLQERGFDVVRGKGKTEKNIENIHEYKQVKQLEKKVNQEKNKLIKELKSIELNKQPLADIEQVKKRSFERGVVNKRIELAPKDFDNLLHSAKENEKLRRLYIQSKNDNQKLKKDNQNLKKEFKVLHNEYQEILDQQEETNQKLENKNAELLKENQTLKNELHEFEIYNIAHTDILFEDYNISLPLIPFEEIHARYILCQIDDFEQEPQSLEEGYEWQSILEKGRETNIEPDRLERAISKVKEFIEKFKEKVIARRKNKEQDMER